MEEKVKLSVLGFSFNQNKSGAYGLVLAEQNGVRRLIVMIGTPEAQSIAFKLQGSDPPRPLTHDLIDTLLSQFHIELKEAVIYKYENGIFYSKLVFKHGDDILEIDSRTSDAIAIALRTGSPIYTTSRIMRDQAVIFDEADQIDNEEEDVKDNFAPDYSSLSQDELESLLANAVRNEDYELASFLRDELNKKKDEQ